MSKYEKWSSDVFDVIMILIMSISVAVVIIVVLHGVSQINIKTPKETMLDAYQTFEQECLIREYTKDQCLLIWSRDDD